MRELSIHRCCGWFKLIVVFSTSTNLIVEVVGFRPLQQQIQQPKCNAFLSNPQRDPQQKRQNGSTKLSMAMNPQDMVDSVSQLTQESPAWHAILSTMYTATTATGQLLPAHEHTQPFFGPPDPYLSSGHSIAPAVKNLIDMGVETTKNNNYIDYNPADSAIMEQVKELPKAAQIALSKGWNVIDGSKLKLGGMTAESNVLPGFVQNNGILPHHAKFLPEETPESFARQVEWSANFLNVVDKLPNAAFLYALVEFFILRPGIDLYKEDIQEDRSLIFAETVTVTAVRFGVFAVIAILTLGIFG